MRKLLVLALLLLSLKSHAVEIKNGEQKSQVNVARVVQLINLANNDVMANIVVRDLGGSTDLSPTQQVFFTLYAKGEMFSTDAAFDLGPAFAVKSAKRLDSGIYEVVMQQYDYDSNKFSDVTYRIDAVKAITDIKAVNCGGEFDCPASEKFQTSIFVFQQM